MPIDAPFPSFGEDPWGAKIEAWRQNVENEVNTLPAQISDPGTPVGAALSATLATFVSSDGITSLIGRSLFANRDFYANGDSFGVDLGNGTPYPALLAALVGTGSVENGHISGSFFQDVSMRMINLLQGATHSADSTVVINGGINAPATFTWNETVRNAEMDSLESIILVAATEAGLPTASWTFTGSWTTYDFDAALLFPEHTSKTTSAAGDFATVTPERGDYFALTYSVTSFPFSRGRWLVNGVEKKSEIIENGAPDTNIQSNRVSGASSIQPHVVNLGSLSGTDVVRVETAGGSNGVFLHGLLRLSQTPPRIVVLMPTYVTGASSYSVELTKNVVDWYRDAIRSVVERVTTAWPTLRGRIAIADPVLNGWNPDTMTSGDGLHPNAAGSIFLRDSILSALSTIV